MSNGDMTAMPIFSKHGIANMGEEGLTKREHYAGLAMQGFITAGFNGMPDASELAFLATNYADALLEELDK